MPSVIKKLQEVQKINKNGIGAVPAAKPTKFKAPTKDELPMSSLSIKPDNSANFKPHNASAFVD